MLTGMRNMSRKAVVGLSIDAELLAELDKTRGDIPRSKFVTRVLEKSLAARGIHSVRSQPVVTDSEAPNPGVVDG